MFITEVVVYEVPDDAVSVWSGQNGVIIEVGASELTPERRMFSAVQCVGVSREALALGALPDEWATVLPDDEPSGFTVVSADDDEVLSWSRTIDLQYGDDTYSIDLSYDGYNGYEWEERDALPDGLREMLDDMDLFDLDEQSAALQ